MSAKNWAWRGCPDDRAERVSSRSLSGSAEGSAEGKRLVNDDCLGWEIGVPWFIDRTWGVARDAFDDLAEKGRECEEVEENDGEKDMAGLRRGEGQRSLQR